MSRSAHMAPMIPDDGIPMVAGVMVQPKVEAVDPI